MITTDILFWFSFRSEIHLHCISFQKHLMGRFRSPRETKNKLQKTKAFFAILLFCVNLSIIILGVVTQPSETPTFILGWLIVNGLLYTSFYMSMKLAYKELIPPVVYALAVLALVFWIPALYLFVQKAKDTSLTPAQSRAKNEECLISMFDKHDIWHFLSGAGLLTVFLILLVIDDGIAEVPYDKIPTF